MLIGRRAFSSATADVIAAILEPEPDFSLLAEGRSLSAALQRLNVVGVY